MASLHKVKKSPYWHCSYKLPNGKWTLRSTKTSDDKEAQLVCNQMEAASEAGAAGRLTQDAALKMLWRNMQTIAESSGWNLADMPTVEGFVNQWIANKAPGTSPSTAAKYKGALEAFVECLGASAKHPIASLDTSGVVSFRDALIARVAPETVNFSVRLVGRVLQDAVKARWLDRNPADSVERVAVERKESGRRAFTLGELKKLLESLDKYSDWYGMVLIGFYTGQRLCDCSSLAWGQVDCLRRTIRFVQKKTGKSVEIPMHQSLSDFLELGAGSSKDWNVFPSLSGLTSSSLGRAFRDILFRSGLASHDSPEAAEKTGDRRRVEPLSFHSLRHSAISELKSAGASNAVAESLAGHESSAVNRAYTHVSADDLRRDVERLPSVV
jgi:integrase